MVPSTWVKGIICPILKSASSDPRVPLNYRGISLLPVVSKLYTGLISSRFSEHLEKNGLIANEQNGFRPDRSCLDHIFTLQEILRVRKAQNRESFCSFVDFQKAFDYVDHDFLMFKLANIGVDCNIYRSIKAI